MELAHASFFSGVGGLDLGLERAGWRTVSFSEIDPYACAVLAERWPGVPNLGSIADLARGREGVGGGEQHRQHAGRVRLAERSSVRGSAGRDDIGVVNDGRHGDPDWRDAVLWTGGFPCQDLSVAGKRRGMGTHADRLDTRSGLAYAFLDLVERHRPPAIVLENVPGLLSSNGGRDLGALLGRLGELGYWWAYRVLDARHFGVPQRRRRVFIVAIHARIDPSGDGPAAILSVGSRCDRHPPTGGEARAGAPGGASVGTLNARMGTGVHNGQDDHAGFLIPEVAPTLRRGAHGDPGIGRDNDHDRLIVSASLDPRGVRAADGLAGWLDDREVVNALDQRRGGADDNEAQAGHLIAAFVKRGRAQTADDGETWGEGDVMPTLNAFVGGSGGEADPLLPLGLDSHRYRCCGNGVVAPVAEWLGRRLADCLA